MSKQPGEKFFHFKQFRLTDQGCAMKIGTDGLILGAWAAKIARKASPQYLLDVGTGCGLIALMMAQKTSGIIHAIDTDRAAFETAQYNFEHSPWSKRLMASHSSLQKYSLHPPVRYGMIVCNPPYFQNSMKSPDKARTLARHSQELTFEDLFRCSAKLLSENGCLVIIYPVDVTEQVSHEAARSGFGEIKRLWIHPETERPPKRIISEFYRGKNLLTENIHLAIETGQRHNFSKEYQALTCDYHPFLPGTTPT